MFSEGDLVWKVILPIRTKATKFGKWLPNWKEHFIITHIIYGAAYKLSTLEGEELARSISGKYLKEYHPIMGEAIKIKKS